MLNHELIFLIFTTLTLLCFLFLLLMYLMIRKVNDNKKRREIENFKNKIQSTIFAIIAEGQVHRKFSVNTTIKRKALEELLSRYVKILEGKEERQRLSELASLYLAGYYRKRLKSKRWSQRMNALYHIEDFTLIILQDDIVALTGKKNNSHQERIQLLRILAVFQYNGLKNLLTEKFYWLSEYEYRSIVMKLEQGLFDQFVLGFHQSSSQLQLAILDVISIKKSVNYQSFTEHIFTAYKGEIRLRALKALAEIGFVKNIEPCLEMLKSEKWQERMVAAKLIGSIKEEKGVPKLIELLHDQTWWVRSQAGQAISQFPNGKLILQSVLDTSNDTYAKDMAWEWLLKGV